MKHYIRCVVILVMALLAISCSHEQAFYVSPEGKDDNPGTREQPFATLQRAMDSVQALRSGQSGKQMKVFLREGVYYLEKGIRMEGKAGEEGEGGEAGKAGKKGNPPLVISSFHGEEVIFSGGKNIPPDAIVPVSDMEIRERFTPGARDAIKQVNLKALGISGYGAMRNVGFARPYGPSWGEIFVNKKPMHLSRWPNKGMIPMGQVLDKGSVPRDDDFSNRGGVMMYDSSRIDRWSAEKDAWISGYFMWGYADDMVKIASVNTKKKTITTATATLYGFGNDHPWNKWYGINILAELDEAGEYYIDREEGILYFISGDRKITSLELSMLEAPFFFLEGVSDITISGITFECSRGLAVAMDNTRNISIEKCIFRNLGSLAITLGKGIEPFADYRHEGVGRPAPGIVGSLHQHLYASTTFKREGGNNNKITGCRFYNLGAGGISLGGGDRLTLEAGNNVIENCIFHDLNRIERSYRPAIDITGVGNQVRHCEIYHMPNQAILMHGNNHLIEYNYFHDVVTEAEDAGAVYYGRDPSERGIVIRYNYFENIPVRSHVTMALYADDGACNLTVTGNVFYKAGGINIMLGGGNDHTITNNIFIGSKTGIHVDNRLQNWGADMVQPGGIFEKRLKAVHYDQPPYSIRYPELPGYFRSAGALSGAPTGNVAENNVFIDVEEMVLYEGYGLEATGKEHWIDLKESNWETGHAEVGFTDWKNRDFSLAPGSVIYKKLPGFHEIPFHEIGLYINVE